jgi:hypothetical protein
MTTIDDGVDAALIERILGEYREMPGLALSIPQAQRLWACDRDTCCRVTDALVQARRLCWSSDGLLILRGDDGPSLRRSRRFYGSL